MKYYLAIDIGASSGRHILGHIENGKMLTEEVFRFENGMKEINGHLCWDSEALFENILLGMKKCTEIGKIPESLGIDTWGVDFALLDKNGSLIGNTVGYRDSRTKGCDTEVYKIISEEDLYARTGIQKQLFNTVYQLMAVKKAGDLEKAETMLLMPDYFNYLLTGKKLTEYTNASTTQLLNPETKQWDFELIDMLGYPRRLFTDIELPGTQVGSLKDEIAEKAGFNCRVVLPATHDTGSAVAAVPSDSNSVLYISSGTWSLMGTELQKADTSPESRLRNLTNEGGYDYRFRYLKNIMGLWMINSAKAETAPDMSYGELCEKASLEKIASIVPANDDRFLAPKSMSEEVKKACAETGQQVPQTPSEIAAVIYNSLAACYKETLEEIQSMTGLKYDSISIIGGGSNADYLNRLTANACRKTVYAGPSEATAIGNLAVQMIADGEIENLFAARKLIFKSFNVKTYEPKGF